MAPLCPKSSATQLRTAIPSFTPVITPSCVTVNIDVSDDEYVTFLFTLSLGVNLKSTVFEPPTAMYSAFEPKAIDTSLSLTVTSIVAVAIV